MVCQFLIPISKDGVRAVGCYLGSRTAREHRMGMADRCEYVAENMFESVRSADAYIMTLILYDRNDDECVQIPQNQYQAAKPGSRVLCGACHPRRRHASFFQVV